MSIELTAVTSRKRLDVDPRARQVAVTDFLLTLFAALEQRSIRYCVLRDGDRLLQMADPEEVDLLVAEHQLDSLRAILAEFGFVELSGWGHAPHHFFLIYDEHAGRWLKLDVVTQLNYGRPVRALRTRLAEPCLAGRRRWEPTYILAAEDELITLLLHCVLDKGSFDLSRRQRLGILRQEVTETAYLSSHLAEYWLPSVRWAELAALLEDEDWGTILAYERAVVRRLRDRDRVGTTTRGLRARVLRKLNRWVGFRRLRVPMVALLAPDGAGKTTLAESLAASSYFPVRTIYMGLYQSGQSRSRGFRVPGLGLANRILTQWRRYVAARYHQSRGRLVIFDRYTYDSLLSTREPLGGARKLRRWLLAHACPPPDLVIILDAPGELLYTRKREHTVKVLEKQRQDYLQLQSQLPQAVVIDATQDSDIVRREAMALIWRSVGKRLRRSGATS